MWGIGHPKLGEKNGRATLISCIKKVAFGIFEHTNKGCFQSLSIQSDDSVTFIKHKGDEVLSLKDYLSQGSFKSLQFNFHKMPDY